jgi:hypothetical protein
MLTSHGPDHDRGDVVVRTAALAEVTYCAVQRTCRPVVAPAVDFTRRANRTATATPDGCSAIDHRAGRFQ